MVDTCLTITLHFSARLPVFVPFISLCDDITAIQIIAVSGRFKFLIIPYSRAVNNRKQLRIITLKTVKNRLSTVITTETLPKEDGYEKVSIFLVIRKNRNVIVYFRLRLNNSS